MHQLLLSADTGINLASRQGRPAAPRAGCGPQGLAGHVFDAAKQQVRAFLRRPLSDTVLASAFGDGIGVKVVAEVVRRFDLDGWPGLVVADAGVLGPAHGAYAAANDTIYVARSLLQNSMGDLSRATGVIVHEIGHAIDDRLGTDEARGDEGAIFAALVQGRRLTSAELTRLQGVDDHGFIVVGGHSLAAEFAKYGTVTIDGNLSEWTAAQRIDGVANAVAGYALYGSVQANTYLVAVQATAATDQVIGAGTILWLNTDQNTATGYSPFGSIGAEYNVTFDAAGKPYLYTGASGQTRVSATPLDFALSPDGKSFEIAIPRSLVTPAGGTAPKSISIAGEINNYAGNPNTVYLPGDYFNKPEYQIKDPAAQGPPKIYGTITVDGSLSEWTAAQRIDGPANAVAGYALYGSVQADTYLIAIQATASTDQAIGAGTILWLNTDQNTATGYSPFGNIGAEYNVTFDAGGTPYLYTGASGQTRVSATPLNFALSPDGKSLEIAIPRSLVTPAGGTAPKSISIAAEIDNYAGNPNTVYLPGDYFNKPEYQIKDPAAQGPPKVYGTITVDGSLSEWTPAQRIDGPANAVAGYALYGSVQADTDLVAIQATALTDQAIGAGTILWLNTDQNTATGYSPFGNIGAEYNVTFDAGGTPYLYTGASGQTRVSATPLNFALSADGKSLEIAIPRSLVTPAGGTAPKSISIAGEIDNVAGNPNTVYLPGDYFSKPEYTITDPATIVARTPTHKVAIVYSDTSASRYFSQAAYSDLVLAAQNQARIAGVSYDLIDESQLTNVNNLLAYDALVIPSMAFVNTAQLSQITTALNSAESNYHIGIITSGDFLTNDQTGAPLAGNAYVNMQNLLNLQRYTGGNNGAVTATANDVGNPILQGYTAGQTITSYVNVGYAAYQAVTGAADVLVNQNVSGVGTLPGVVETTTGGTNVHFATAGLFADSNLLSHAIQSTVLGNQPGLTLHTSRQAGIFAARMDMDQSQFPSDVSPSSGGGIYSKLIPILQQWKQQYNFVGSYYINIGDSPNGASQSSTNWAASLPYYQQIQALGGEIGNHSYTHLINPPATPIAEVTTTAAPSGSTQITLNAVPSFAGVTVGMFVSGPNIGAGTQVTAVSGNTITISYVPGGYGGANAGTLGNIPAGSKLNFSVPDENTNFLQTGSGGVPSATGSPFTYEFEFNQSKAIEEQNLGTKVYGAAIPGANETYATDKNILPYYQSGNGYAGYVTGGWTGIGSGSPSAFGYVDPANQNSVYIAPNITFDFTEVQYQHKTPAQALADWSSQLGQITANAAGTPIAVWPIHDYGPTQWDTTGTGAASPYTTQMFTDFISQASQANYEFVTLEDLAYRIAAEQKTSLNFTTSGNTINATVTPNSAAADLGVMALNVSNGQHIASVSNWYAYNDTSVFLTDAGGSYSVNLGLTPADVTHITSLPSRDHLISLVASTAGPAKDLSFMLTGDAGQVTVQMQNGASNIAVTGATVASQAGNQLVLNLSGTNQYNVDLKWT